MNRRALLAACLCAPGAAAACTPDTPAPPATRAVTGATALDIDLPDAPLVRVRLFDFAPRYPGSNGGRIDMRTSPDGVSFAEALGSYSWAFAEFYDNASVLYTASATDHRMTDRVRLCTATSQAGGAEFELLFARPFSSAPKLWRWSGNTQFIDGRVCGYQGHAVQLATSPIGTIRLFPDTGTFSLSYSVQAVEA